jgi:biofilm PGA synthesis N-glycosyltransferase PgaC
MSSDGCNYVVVSPVRDEAKHVEVTLRSVTGQTLRPSLWVIVDDGSQDETPEIVAAWAMEHPWIRTLRIERDTPRGPGSAVVRAFQAGFELVRISRFDFIVKLDCDMEFAPDYFERLLAKFHQDERLGIASGSYLEQQHGEWQPVWMPPYHACGASKVIRAKCWEEIGGFVPARGWDTVDEIRAQCRGWKTAHFPELKMRHHRREGEGIGQLRTNAMHGEVYYSTGGGFFFFLLKVLHRMFSGRPYLFGGLALFWGYLKPLLGGQARLVTAAEARHYRRLLNARIWSGFGRLAGGLRMKPAPRGTH